MSENVQSRGLLLAKLAATVVVAGALVAGLLFPLIGGTGLVARNSASLLDALREASYFVDRLSSEGMPLAGLVLNRTHPPATTTLSATRAEGAAEEVADAGADGADVAAAALRVHAERMVAATREQHLADRFTSAHPEVAVRTVPAAATAAPSAPDSATSSAAPSARVADSAVVAGGCVRFRTSPASGMPSAESRSTK